jgi:diguanylate cyclase (GGDEF)-like protein
MLKSSLGRLWAQAWSMVFEDSSAQLHAWLYGSKQHTMRLTTRRVSTIVARVRLIAVTLAVVSPLWVLVDFWAFPPELAQNLALVRTLCAVAFAAVVVMAQGVHTLRDAHRALFFLFAVPAAFYLFANLHLLHMDADGVLDGFSIGFGYFPLIMLASLALFPLTLAECMGLVGFALAVNLVAFAPSFPAMDWLAFLGTFWVLLVVGVIGTLSSVSQLAYLIVVVRDGLRDSVTGAYSRRPGEEFLELQFTWCKRAGQPLAMALLEVDGLQRLNDKHGYAAGEAVLVTLTQKLNDNMRDGDTLIRWTGKQFLLVFPSAAVPLSVAVLGRILSSGLGSRPDGTPVTASIGVVERIQDDAEDWWQLIDLAESRVAAAQSAGGNRTIEPEAHASAVTEDAANAA